VVSGKGPTVGWRRRANRWRCPQKRKSRVDDSTPLEGVGEIAEKLLEIY